MRKSGVEIDHFSECPGCGKIGHTVQEWTHRDGQAIQLMHCPESNCRVDGYYPEEIQ